MIQRFENRRESGKVLAARLSEFENRQDVVVLALPRGGVPVAFEVARALNAPLDVFMVRKLGVPGQEELAFGAISSGGTTVFNESLVHALRITDGMIEKVIDKELKELERREELYRANRRPINLEGKTVIIVDDGLATGATMKAAVSAVKIAKPKKIIVAAPVASRGTCEEIMRKSDDLCICAMTPEPFYGVGMWYRNFDQTTDQEVISLLNRSESVKSAGQ